MTRQNFCWIATWKITDRCNLNCAYCDSSIMKRADASEVIDRFEILERIRAYGPRILHISGGEPSLVKELPEILSKAKETWDPHIRVVHNGTAPEKLADSFPYIDRLVISVDGPDGINAATRGIDGARVLDKIAALVSAYKNALPAVCINTVVTIENLDTLPAFAAQIESVSPEILLGLSPVMPFDCELSILRNRDDGYRRFLDTYAKMTAAHPLTVQNFDCVMRHDDFRKIQCYNQYFTMRFSPRGELFSCGASLRSQLKRSDGAFKKIFKKGGVKKLFTMIMKSIRGGMGKPDFTCYNMCNCKTWLDMLMLGKDAAYASMASSWLRGRLTDDDYKELHAFVKTNVNPSFDVDWFRAMVDGVNES